MNVSEIASSGVPSSRSSASSGSKLRVFARACGKTDVGRQRHHNEDDFLVDGSCHVFAVFDGMGGNNAGEVASALGTRSLRNFFQATEKVPIGCEEGDEELPDAARRLLMGVRKANADIFEISNTHLEHRGMGSTVVALHLGREEGRVHIAHVGDSRCYRVRNGAIEQLTRDHSLISDALAWNPNLTKEELARLPRNIISRALGLRRVVEIDLLSQTAQPGDLFLLCSDGLSGMLSDEQILELVRLSDDLPETCDNLIAVANEAGGTDNITALLVRVHADETVPIDAAAGPLAETLPGPPPVAGPAPESVIVDDTTIQTTVTELCPFCGRQRLVDEPFCGQCGTRLVP
jgi:protein phosphatase